MLIVLFYAFKINYILCIGNWYKITANCLMNFKEISRKLCIQSKEFREILMSKMGNFYFENGSTDSCILDRHVHELITEVLVISDFKID